MNDGPFRDVPIDPVTKLMVEDHIVMQAHLAKSTGNSVCYPAASVTLNASLSNVYSNAHFVQKMWEPVVLSCALSWSGAACRHLMTA